MYVYDRLVLRLPPLTLVLACLYGVVHHSETSYTWRLDVDMGKVMPATHIPHSLPDSSTAADREQQHGAQGDPLKLQEAVLDILMSTVTNPDGTWKKTSTEAACQRGGCRHDRKGQPDSSSFPRVVNRNNNRGLAEVEDEGDDYENADTDEDLSGEVLDCGKPVNFTYYDHLVGIQNRHSHPQIPEPEVAHTFGKHHRKGGGGSSIASIERGLKKSKRERPKSVELYNQIGNFWRIHGDTRKTIECFRRALAVSPNNADILLNLARVLFNLQYLDDAIFLTRRSLEVQPPDQNAWPQHFQLGEILKAYGHHQEAALHLRHVLELKPGHAPALQALRDMESAPDASVHGFTIVIIVLLAVGVVGWIFTTADGPKNSEGSELSTEHRHAVAASKGTGGTSSLSKMRWKHNRRFL